MDGESGGASHLYNRKKFNNKPKPLRKKRKKKKKKKR